MRAGFDEAQDTINYGGAFSYLGGNINGDQLTTQFHQAQADGYLLGRFGVAAVGLEGGLSFDQFSGIARKTGIPTVTAMGSTSGVSYYLAATLGTQYGLGGVTLTPALRVGYIGANVNGFSESAPLLGLQYGDQSIGSAFWTARLRASTPLVGALTGFGEVGYEGLISPDNTYTAKLVGNTAHQVTVHQSFDVGGLYLKAGIEGAISGMKVSGEFGLSRGAEVTAETAQLRVSMPF